MSATLTLGPIPNALSLTIPDTMWAPDNTDGDPFARLLGPTLYLNGTGHHLSALLVTFPEEDIQTFADPAAEQDLMPALQTLYEGAYQTTPIHGREYVVYLIPFAD